MVFASPRPSFATQVSTQALVAATGCDDIEPHQVAPLSSPQDADLFWPNVWLAQFGFDQAPFAARFFEAMDAEPRANGFQYLP